MFKNSPAFGGFSVNDLDEAKIFYSQTLGLDVIETDNGLRLHLATGGTVFIYPKPDHVPATFTVLNFPTENLDQAVEALKQLGIAFEHYSAATNDSGIARGPKIAWFKDPAGNFLSVLEQPAE